MIEQILNIIRACWPIRMVLPDQKGVWVFFGKWHKNVNPGLYLIIPAMTDIYTIETTEQVCDFPQMALTTKDNKGLILDGTISYTISDPFKALFKVSNLDLTIRSRTMGAICDYISRQKREDCITQDGTQEAILEDLDEIQDEFGFEIIKLDITTNIQARGIYLAGAKE